MKKLTSYLLPIPDAKRAHFSQIQYLDIAQPPLVLGLKSMLLLSVLRQLS
jgi:hypothetical protein